MSDRTANISHDCFSAYTGTAITTDYNFVCWVGDEIGRASCRVVV